MGIRTGVVPSPDRRRIVPLAIALFSTAALAAAQDEAAVVSRAPVPGALLEIPLFVRDVSGTPLGVDAGTGNRIQGFAISLVYSPASSVASIDFERAGLTEGLPALFESEIHSSDRISWIASFSESASPIDFILDAPAPGDLIGRFLIRVAAEAPGGGSVDLDFHVESTTLSNQAGTVGESATNGQLSLVNGSLAIVDCSSLPDVALAHQTIDFPLVCEAASSITLGPGLQVIAPGSALLRAGNRIVFAAEVVVGSGAGLTMEID